MFDVNCDQPGQHVTFLQPITSKDDVFTLCEIQVFGKWSQNQYYFMLSVFVCQFVVVVISFVLFCLFVLLLLFLY